MTVPMLREPEAFELAQRMAGAFAKSEMVPETLRGSTANCLSAMLLAEELGESTLMVLNHIYFVHGRPSFLTKFMIARANKAGVFTGPLRWIDGGTDATPSETCFADLANVQGDARVEITIDLKTAIESGWTTYKDRQGRIQTHARWSTLAMQRQMLRWRSASWLINLYAPNCMLGIPTREELEDISGREEMKDITPPPPRLDDFKPGASVAPAQEETETADDSPEKVAADTQAKRIRDQIARAKHIEWLNANALFGPSAADDERLIKAQAGGDAVWADLIDRDAKRRLELAEGADA